MGTDRKSLAILAAIVVDRTDQVPLFRQIYERVRGGIASGTFSAGTRLPSARNLASELGVARGTIEDAYGLLAAEGYVERHGPAGTSVATLATGKTAVGRTAGPSATPREVRGLPTTSEVETSPFQMGRPAFDAFPGTLWSRLVARAGRRSPTTSRGAPDPLGYAPLRAAIARYLALSRGVTCAPGQIMITNGFQGAIDLVAHATLKAGDQVWVEDPGYVPTRQALAGAGARVVPIAVDRDGIRVADGIARASRARLAITTPAHQAPLCVALSLPRRLSMLEWAAGSDAWIVEDDYDGEFHYAGRPLPALKSLDRRDRVIYAGSFSKTLFPDLRLGYLVGPVGLAERLSEVARRRSASPGTFMQTVVASFIEEGHFVRHLARMRRLYGNRRRSLVRELQRTFGPTLVLDVERGGMHIVARPRNGASDQLIADRARQAGLAVNTLSSQRAGRRADNGLLISFTNVEERRAATLCRKLHQAIGALL